MRPASAAITSIIGTEICGSSSRGVARMPSSPTASDAMRHQRRELRAQERLGDASGDAHRQFPAAERRAPSGTHDAVTRAQPGGHFDHVTDRAAKSHPAPVVALRGPQRHAGEIALAHDRDGRHDERRAAAPSARASVAAAAGEERRVGIRRRAR